MRNDHNKCDLRLSRSQFDPQGEAREFCNRTSPLKSFYDISLLNESFRPFPSMVNLFNFPLQGVILEAEELVIAVTSLVTISSTMLLS